MTNLTYDLHFYHSADNNSGIIASFETIEDARTAMIAKAIEWNETISNVKLFQWLNRIDAEAKGYSMSLTIWRSDSDPQFSTNVVA